MYPHNRLCEKFVSGKRQEISTGCQPESALLAQPTKHTFRGKMNKYIADCVRWLLKQNGVRMVGVSKFSTSFLGTSATGDHLPGFTLRTSKEEVPVRLPMGEFLRL